MKRLIWTIAATGAAAALTAGLQGTAIASETIAYTYDALGRLVQVQHSGSVNNGEIANYSFDSADNRDTVNVVAK